MLSNTAVRLSAAMCVLTTTAAAAFFELLFGQSQITHVPGTFIGGLLFYVLWTSKLCNKTNEPIDPKLIIPTKNWIRYSYICLFTGFCLAATVFSTFSESPALIKMFISALFTLIAVNEFLYLFPLTLFNRHIDKSNETFHD